MSLFKEYIEYLKDNPKGYWFKAKLYGWGWTPVKWQGWLVIISFVFFLVLNVINLESKPIPTDNELAWFFVRIILLVFIMIYICYKKGEKPRWQWGPPKNLK
jgi:hypothetical protein